MLLLTKPPLPPNPFWNDDVLKYLIPTVVTLVVFILGLFAGWFNANSQRRRRYKQLRGLFATWIPNLEAPINTFSANCVDFSQRLLASESLSAESMAFIPLNAEKLAGMDIQELMKAFLYNSTGDQHQNNQQLYYIISNLDYLVNLGPEISAKYEEHYKSANLLLKEWNIAFTKLSDLQGKVFTNQPVKSPARVAMEERLRANIFAWSAALRAHPQNTRVTYEQLLVPNIEELQRYFNLIHSEEPDLIDFNAELHNAAIVFRQWRAGHEGYATIFTNYGIKLRNCFHKLEESITHFSQGTQVKWFTT